MCEFDGHFVLVEVAFRVASIYPPNHNPDRDDFFVRSVNAIDPTVSYSSVRRLQHGL